jgi:mannose/fructose-specific phosphotransferase system component IIA
MAPPLPLSPTVVLVGHGQSAPSLLAAAEALVGPIANIAVLSCDHGACCGTLEGRLREVIAQLAPTTKILFITDLKGSTPYKLCVAEARRRAPYDAAVLCGLSLPMLLKLTTARGAASTPAELAGALASTAQRAIDVEVFSP